MDRSTGEGVSPSTTVLLRPDRVDRSSGVEFVDLDARVPFFKLCDGFDGRMAGDCRLREGLSSSPLWEAARLID